MIALDTNLLVYAHRPEVPLHAKAKACIGDLARSRAPYAIPFHCLVEFSGIATHPKLWRQPSSPAQVAQQVRAWLAPACSLLLTDDSASLDTFLQMLAEARVAGGLVHDARIASVCLSQGIRELWSVDRDFSRFSRLRVRNPL